MRRPFVILAVALGASIGLAACGGLIEESTRGGTESPIILPDTIVPPGAITTAAGVPEPSSAGAVAPDVATDPVVQPLVIMVTSDDGVSSAGLDALAAGLRTVEFTEIVVVAPQAGSVGAGDTVSSGPLTVTQTTTVSGLAATTVAGTPADSVVWAIEQNGLPRRPDLVVVGIDDTVNVSTETIALSGATGAARRAATAGVPALVVGLTPGSSDVSLAVQAAISWITTHGVELASEALEGGLTVFTNLTVPACTPHRGELEIAPAPLAGRDLNVAPDCASTATPLDDVSAYQAGFVVVSSIPL